MSVHYDILFKIIIVGDSGVGKSCIIQSYVNDFFSESYISTIGVDFLIKELDIDNKKIKLQIWDTAGQERFQTITSSYYRHAQGILLVYDITNIISFNNILKWIEQIDKYSSKSIPIIILGNKKDLESERVILTIQGIELAYKHNALFQEVSAKDRQSIEIAIKNLLPLMFSQIKVIDNNKNDKITTHFSPDGEVINKMTMKDNCLC